MNMGFATTAARKASNAVRYKPLKRYPTVVASNIKDITRSILEYFIIKPS